jgi:hypothetical protein
LINKIHDDDSSQGTPVMGWVTKKGTNLRAMQASSIFHPGSTASTPPSPRNPFITAPPIHYHSTVETNSGIIPLSWNEWLASGKMIFEKVNMGARGHHKFPQVTIMLYR